LTLVAAILGACQQAGWLETATTLVLFGLWLIKELALYPLYRRALGAGPPAGAAALHGQTGQAVTALAPSGHIRVAGELWRARTRDGDHLATGSLVVVVDHEALTLVVSHDVASGGPRAAAAERDTRG
jgi:membrane-bound ClpP family serine protease